MKFITEEVVRLSGWVDVSNVADLRLRLSKVESPAVIDCSGLEMIQAAGIREIVMLERRLGVGNVFLTSVPSNVRRIFQILGLERWCTPQLDASEHDVFSILVIA